MSAELEERARRAEEREASAVEQLKRLWARVAELEGPIPAMQSESVDAEIHRWLDERKAKGLETYGRGLSTFNGRNAHHDELEEFIDGFKYRLQALMERRRLEERLRDSETRRVRANALLRSVRLSWNTATVVNWLAERDAFLGQPQPEPVFAQSEEEGG